MARTLSVRLDISHSQVRKTLEQIVAVQDDVVLQSDRSTGTPHLLILDLDEADPASTFARINALTVSGAAPAILLIADRADQTILLDALRAGVNEFLTHPLTRDAVEQALARLRARLDDRHPEHPGNRGKILSLLGGKGGVGTSTVTVNLGCCLHELTPRYSVVLVDLNPQGGDLPLFLDLEPTRSFQDIARDLSRLDHSFLQNLLTQHPSGLWLLPFGEPEAAGTMAPDCVDQTLELLQTMFEYVLVDCGQGLDPNILPALKRASMVLLVATVSVPVLRRTSHLLDRLQLEGQAEKIRLVMNRYTPSVDELLMEAESVLKHNIFWKIPNDYYAASTAMNTGQPLAAGAPRAELTKSYQQLAAALTKDGANREHTFLASYLAAIKETWVKQRHARAVAR